MTVSPDRSPNDLCAAKHRAFTTSRVPGSESPGLHLIHAMKRGPRHGTGQHKLASFVLQEGTRDPAVQRHGSLLWVEQLGDEVRKEKHSDHVDNLHGESHIVHSQHLRFSPIDPLYVGDIIILSVSIVEPAGLTVWKATTSVVSTYASAPHLLGVEGPSCRTSTQNLRMRSLQSSHCSRRRALPFQAPSLP